MRAIGTASKQALFNDSDSDPQGPADGFVPFKSQAHVIRHTAVAGRLS